MRKDNMKNRFPRMALIAVVGFVAVLALAPVRPVFSQAASKQTPSTPAAKQLKAAEEAIHAKKYDVAKAKLKEVEALSAKTAYDEYIVNEMQGYLDTRAKNYQGAEKDLEGSLNSGFMKQSEVPARIKELATINLDIKDYNKAIDFGMRAIKGGFADDATYQVLEQAYYLKGDYWGNLINSLFSRDDYKEDVPKLQLLRLAFDVNVLKNPPDFTDMAQLDLDENNPG